ncbi:MAG: serine/threonine protein kinase [Gemmataceae bacterium]|nr:serine/threonine protein kinase [Gemmataceae bacterium]
MAEKPAAVRPKTTAGVAKRPAAPVGDDTIEGTMAPRAVAKKPVALDQTAAYEEDAAESVGGDTGVSEEAPEQERTQAMAEGEASARRAAAAPKATTLGDFKLLKKIGQGGMGAVFRARQISLDREVAVKVLSKELSGKPAFVQRFQREAKVMARLDHPNILRCYGAGSALGYHFIAIEFVEGGSLENWLKKLKKFSIGDALHSIITVARALEHAHELKMMHRDVKPDNVLLTKKGVLKVADLGLAKAQDDDMQLTKTGTGAGTPIYMAPEQARDAKHVDHRCDIYALGCMLYVFLTGQAPFKGETLVELIEAKEKGKFKPMRTYDSSIPERLDLIVDKMLAKKPELRYASCSEVADELEALGLANDRLSFFGDAAAAPRGGKAAPSQPAASAVKKSVATALPPQEAEEPESDTMVEKTGWFVQFASPNGKTLTKKLEQDELERMIKLGSIDAKAKVSRQANGGFRTIGTVREFQELFRSKQVRAKTDPGAGKFKSLVDQYDKEDQRRRFWGKFRARAGSIVFWLILLGALGAGGWFGYNYAVSAGYWK